MDNDLLIMLINTLLQSADNDRLRLIYRFARGVCD